MPTDDTRNARFGGRKQPSGQVAAPRQSHICGQVLQLVLLFCLAMPSGGCGGCRDNANKPKTAEELEQQELERQRRLAEEAKKKPDYEFIRLSTLPNNITTIDSSFKPGHWTSATLEARANNFDFKGELTAEVVDKNGYPIELEGLPFTVETSRSLILPKGQKKFADLSFFSPPHVTSSRLRTQLLAGRYGRALMNELMVIQPLPAHQYYFVALTSSPDSYAFLRDMPSIAAPSNRLVERQSEAHYRVIVPRIQHRTPLPTGALQWTAIAYVLWDNLEPGKLTLDQQQALVDWLHWGGQLIVSGPETLDTLSGSFLSPYLPVEASGTRELTADDLSELSANWSHGERALEPKRPWSGIQWDVHPDARVLPNTGQLIVERTAGRGRIVVTGFDLAQRDIRDWPGFDELFNACLLRRPARRFEHSTDISQQVAVDWEKHRAYDPTLTTGLRFFTRDAAAGDPLAVSGNATNRGLREGMRTRNRGYQNPFSTQAAGDSFEPGPPAGPGVAAWSDDNVVAQKAREALQQAAGIVVPDASFVLSVLGIYVLVLAPLNWAVFSLLRRIEWAWIAVPVIAVSCAVVVVRLAQLDIGFARSRTEVAVVEVQGEYDRAHVTRYTALYTSLSTGYDLQFDDPMAMALPLASGQQMVRGQSSEQVHLRREAEVRMEDFEVGSNTTKMIHSEHMLDLGGPIRLARSGGRPRVVNDSQLTLQGAVVVGPGGAAWLGTLAPGATADVVYVANTGDLLFAEERKQAPQTAFVTQSQVLNLRNLIKLAEQQLEPGETRLVAWTDDELDGLSIDPPAKQNRRGDLIVAHLSYGDPRPPERDVNHPSIPATASR